MAKNRRQDVGGRGIFSRMKNCRRPTKPYRRRRHEVGGNPIKNSDPGNRMAGEMKERPGTMGARRFFGYFLAVQKVTQPVKAVDKIIGLHFKKNSYRFKIPKNFRPIYYLKKDLLK